MRISKLLPILILCVSSLAQSNPADEVVKAQRLVSEHKYKDASAILKDAVKKYPNCSPCYLELAFLSLRMEDPDAAMKALDNAVKVADTDASRAQAHRYKGMLLMRGDKKSLQQAENELRQALALNPNELEAHFDLGVTLIRESRDEEGLVEVRRYLETPGTKEEEAYAKKIVANPRAARDTLAPDFSVTTVDGKTISLSQNTGKIIVIDFWATWCPSCRASVPDMKELAKKYPSDRLIIVSSSADSDEKAWREFISKKEMNWPQCLDKGGRLAELFSIHAFPTYIVIDRDGFIRKRIVGSNPQQSIAYQLKAELKSVLE